MAACCYFGADLGNWLDHKFPSRWTDGTPHSSSDLLYFTLLLTFTWTNYSKSNFLCPFCSLGQNYSQSNSSFFFTFDKNFPSQNFLFSSFFLDWKFQVEFQNCKTFLSQALFLTEKIFPVLLTHSILLPLESIQCPLTQASVLACPDSTDELRFWSMSES